MSSDRNAPTDPLSLEVLLDALPLAAALVETAAAAGEGRRLVARNLAWKQLWRGFGPNGGAAGTAVPDTLDHLVAALVDAGQATALAAAIEERRPLDLVLALDLEGPVLWHARGCGLGEHYLLALEPVAEPEELVADWPDDGRAIAHGPGFRYSAALTPDGSWRITSSAPDFRGLLGLDPLSRGWLHLAARSSRKALRSRHLRLLAGSPETSSYGLDLPDGRVLELTDQAVPIRHPATGEVIGLAGWVLLERPVRDGSGRAVAPAVLPRASPESGPQTAPATVPESAIAGAGQAIVRTLEAVGAGALLLDDRGRPIAMGEQATRRLGLAAAVLDAGSLWPHLLPEETISGDKFAALLNDLLAPARGTGAAARTLGGRADVESGRPLELGLCPLDLAGRRLILVVLAEALAEGAQGSAAGGDSRLRDALYFDAVTGLPNRFLCLDRLRQNIARTSANGEHLAVLVLEIERLAVVERAYGRTTAERLRAALAERLAGAIGQLDSGAYLGEARFAVLAGNLAAADEAARIAQFVLDQFREPVLVADREIGSRGRIGIAVFPEDGDTAEALLARAETALERLPPSQEPAYRFYSPAMNAASSDRLLLEQQLLDAIERDEFLLLYQPQISFASSRIVGMEALIRWRHPELGMVPPAEFIPLAEESGAIVAIGEWVMRTACRELAGWLDAGVAPLRLALNISGRQYNDADLVPSVRQTLESTGFPPHLLELELTESVIMEDVVDAAKRLGDLHELGINLAVDDFGTGYSSLSYLKRFPIRSLKLDRSFVRDIAHNETSASIARAIIAFGSALGLKVIAEGVESHDQYDILRGCGCDELQGYLFSRPIPAEDARKLATERRHLPLVRT